MTFATLGMQVLKDKWHYADAISEGAARRIAEALNSSASRRSIAPAVFPRLPGGRGSPPVADG